MTYTKTVYVNEVLPGAERFDIKENDGTAFKANMQIVLALTPTVVGTATDAAHLNNAENQIDALSTLASAQLLVGDSGGVSTKRTITGDVTISNAGVTAIGTGKVTSAMIGTYQILGGTGGNLAGTTITAANLVNNTITAAQIANYTIDAPLIAINTITTSQIALGANIAGSQLAAAAGIVNAQLAANTIDATRLAAPATWTAVTFQHSWTDVGSGYTPAAYYKDLLGIVHLRGYVISGTINQSAFTLPAGYRPPYEEDFYSGNPTTTADIYVKVNADGTVVPSSAGVSAATNLSGITFRP